MTAPIMSVRRTTLVASALVALGPTSMALYTPAMPQLVEAFATTPAVVKTTLTAYFAGFAFSQLLAGPVADAFGRRGSTLVFMAVYILGSLAAVFAPSVEILTAARLVQGIGAAIGVTVSRAIVRDLYPGDRGARIMNMVGIILAIAPAMSPAIGGMTVGLAGWHAVFVLMVLFGLGVGAVSLFALRETIVPDRSAFRPVRIVRAYATLLANAEFLTASVVIACGIGVFYALATMLPFVLIDTVGLTPTQFGFSMLFQSGMFLAGSVTFRVLMRWITPRQAVMPGLVLIFTGSLCLAAAPYLLGTSLLTVMLPVSLYSFGVALMMPFMMMAGMRPFPHIAGQASAMTGFFQIGTGLVAGTIGAWIGDPVLSVATIIPAMGVIAVSAYLFYRRAAARAEREESDANEPVPVDPAPAA
ncbi:multidrug effflux MFS transporter [Oricola thermophila]|uniref:Bcr/CflA family efflux transporter n=1 Tax=Oricola thermophila TaxID=2742145 RepID=A0A6N1VG94_9HYPH|nr:multidrug effflux MFS transporter [Oricola thermophila]QKV19930.1 multidrug effflux MFS transporter [Oricola thermophila]